MIDNNITRASDPVTFTPAIQSMCAKGKLLVVCDTSNGKYGPNLWVWTSLQQWDPLQDTNSVKSGTAFGNAELFKGCADAGLAADSMRNVIFTFKLP
jgi:hypothetical protein